MKIHEYQAKELLAAAGASVPRGLVASTPAEAVQAFDQIGVPVVLKAQIHAGGRGKGRFKDSGQDFGGVKYVSRREEVAAVAEVMLTYPLVTKQTGPEGQKVRQVLVQEAADISREIYLGLVLDRTLSQPVFMASAEGGVEIEEVAAAIPNGFSRRPSIRRRAAAVPGPSPGVRPWIHGRAGAAGRANHHGPGPGLPRKRL